MVVALRVLLLLVAIIVPLGFLREGIHHLYVVSNNSLSKCFLFVHHGGIVSPPHVVVWTVCVKAFVRDLARTAFRFADGFFWTVLFLKINARKNEFLRIFQEPPSLTAV